VPLFAAAALAAVLGTTVSMLPSAVTAGAAVSHSLSATEPSLTFTVASTTAPARGFWRGSAQHIGAAIGVVTASTYSSSDCSGPPVGTASGTPAGTGSWSVTGAVPMGVQRFSARVAATPARRAIASACRVLTVSGTVIPGHPSPIVTLRSSASAATPFLSITPKSNPFPNNVLWSGSLTMAGGISPGGTVTVTDHPGSGCTAQSDWQTSLDFSSGSQPEHATILGYALPTAGSYSIVARYSGDANNTSSSSSCVAYSVSSQPTGDSLGLQLPSSSGSPNQQVTVSVNAGGLTGATKSLIELDLGAGACSSPALTTWTYAASYQRSVSYASTVTVPQAGSYGFSATLYPDADNSGMTSSCSGLDSTAGTNNSAGDYFPLSPFRVLDTRAGTGSPAARLGPGASIDVQVTGVDGSGVPSTGVAAVVLTVTADGASDSSFLTVWPQGTPQPLASSLNVAPGQTIANLVTVRVSPSGRVSIFNHAGSVSVIADVTGYYSDGTTGQGSRLSPASPYRILDTRSGQGTAAAAPLGGERR
jgi:hypothetical protein